MARPRAEQPKLRLVLRGSRFYVRWWKDGAWQRVSTGTEDKREAQRFLKQLEAGMATPEAPAAPVISTILDGYLADRKDRVAAFATLEYAAAALKRHLGDLEPEHLTKERCRFYAARRRAEGHIVGPENDRRKKPTSNGTIIRELVTLRAALKWAVEEKWIDRAPSVEVPSAAPPRDRWLTRDEADQLFQAAEAPHIKLFLHLALHTAARKTALLELQWASVDLDRKLIDLGAAVGNKGRAIVPVNDELLVELRAARLGATSPYVIEHGGGPISDVKTGMAAAARRANLSGVTPHTLRHTAATWMVIAGVPIEAVARFLGHKNPAVTWNIYGHHSPDYLRVAANALTRRTAILGVTGSLAPKTPVDNSR